MFERDLQPFQNMGAPHGAIQVKLGPATDDLLAMVDITAHDLLEIQNARPSVDKREHDDAERRLQLRVLV